MDCSIIPTRYDGLFQVSTTDFFFPLVESPYAQGKIGCANVLSDMYALGVTHIDNMLMILAASRDMPVPEREIVAKEMMRGFNDHAKAAGTRVTGGQTVINPWPIVGGVAMSCAKAEDIIRPDEAYPNPGDVVILTKPLGTQVAVNAKQWLGDEARWAVISDVITSEGANMMYEMAVESMIRLNKTGSELMHKYKAVAATDVTGFGILGHAKNLASNLKSKVDIEIHTLPCIKGSPDVNSKFNFRLLLGYSAETSGGLFLILPASESAAYCAEIKKLTGHSAWVVGRVVEGSNQARIVHDVKVLEVDELDHTSEWLPPTPTPPTEQ